MWMSRKLERARILRSSQPIPLVPTISTLASWKFSKPTLEEANWQKKRGCVALLCVLCGLCYFNNSGWRKGCHWKWECERKKRWRRKHGEEEEEPLKNHMRERVPRSRSELVRVFFSKPQHWFFKNRYLNTRSIGFLKNYVMWVFTILIFKNLMLKSLC